MTDFFTKEMSRVYDERNSRLKPIADNMHFMVRLILKELPTTARILCVGVGTGAEILSLAEAYPAWTFVGVDPSEAMLEVCRERLEAAGVMERTQLIHGYVHDVPLDEPFDAVLSILVGHFVSREERPAFYENMYTHLKRGGVFINTEMSFDLDSEEFPSMLINWERVQMLGGATPESLKKLPELLRTTLTVLPPLETEDLLRVGGFHMPVRFFQAFVLCGWYALKE